MEAQQQERSQGFLWIIFSIIFNHIGKSVERDLQAKVIHKYIDLKEETNVFADGAEFFPLPNIHIRKCKVTIRTKDGIVTFTVPHKTYQKVTVGDTVDARYQTGRFVSDDIKGKEVIL